MKKRLFLFLVLTVALFQGVSFGDELKDKSKAAISAARTWLKLIDKGQYEESYKQSAEFLKKAMPAEEWVKTVASLNEPAKRIIRRVPGATNYLVGEPPKTPEGEYMVIVFHPTYEGGKVGHETVITRLESGTWKVAGYSVTK